MINSGGALRGEQGGAAERRSHIISTLSFPLTHLLISLSLTSLSLVLLTEQSFAEPQPQAQGDWIELREAELEPLPLGAREREVRAAIKRSDWQLAARLIESLDAPQRFLKGWLYIQAEQWGKALKNFKGLEDHSALGDEVLALSAQALLKLDRIKEADQLSARVSRVDVELWRENLRTRGQILRALKRWDEAAQAYESLAKSPHERERGIAALGLGMVAIERGQLEEGIRRLKEVDIQYPTAWVASQARREAKRVTQVHPKLRASWQARSLEERVTRLESLVDHNKSDLVLERAPTLLSGALSDDLKCRVLIAQGRAHDKRRKRAQALKVLKRAVELCHPQRHASTPLALYVAGRAASYTDDHQESNKHFKLLLTQYQHRLSDDAAVFMVRHALEAHRAVATGSAVEIAKLMASPKLSASKRAKLRRLADRDSPGLKRAVEVAREVARLHPRGDLTSEAITFALIGVLRAGRLDLARELTELGTKLPHGPFRFHEAGRATYWRGRVLALSGEVKEARELYEQTLINAPISWYALMAYSRLYELDRKHARSALKQMLTWRPSGLALPSGDQRTWSWRFHVRDPHWKLMKRALMWMRLGLMKRGRRAFRELSQYEERADLQWLSAWALDGYQQYHWSHDILRRKLIEYRHFPPYEFHIKHWLLAYPAPFAEEVKAASSAEGVESQFIWGVMREESGYAERIRSSASAVGLLQLIIGTAKMMRRSSEPEVTLERLGIPSVNIPLGARYLAWVKRKSSCAWSLVPAGYNAGGGALRGWLRDRGYLPLDMFVETIPYEEARWYTKRVNASWITFRTLYGAPKGQQVWPYVSQRTRVPEDNPKPPKVKSLKKSSKKRSKRASKRRKRAQSKKSRKKSRKRSGKKSRGRKRKSKKK